MAGDETASDISHNLYPDSAPSESSAPVKRGVLGELFYDFFPATAEIKVPAKERLHGSLEP